jgi:hypothetical protein
MILVGFDGSAGAVRATAHAARTAREQRQQLIVLDNWESAILGGLLPDSLSDRVELLHAIREDTGVGLAQIITDAGLPDCRWEIRHAVGDLARELTALATTFAADQIVISAQSRSNWPRRRSLARRLNQSGPWIVTVVP